MKRTFEESMMASTSNATSNGHHSEAMHCVKLGHYLLKGTIGTGTFGKVKVGVHEQTNKKVAIKILSRQKMKKLDVVLKVKREIKTLTMLEHPHICKLYQVITTPTDLFLIIEYVGHGELFDFIVKRGRLETSQARRFFQQIVSAVDYCHRKNVVHRDLKPENVLLDEDLNVKVVDFGLSNILSDGDFLRTSCGSPNYAAPEVVSGKLYAGPEVDIWSCGVMLYAFLTGRLPFDDDDIPTLFKRIRSGIFHIPDYLDRRVISLVRHMLQVDPIKRATVKDILEHEWFKSDLPAYLFPPLDDQSLDFSLLDPDVIKKVADLYSCDEFEVISLLQDSHDPREPMKIAYNMLKSSSDSLKSETNGLVNGFEKVATGSKKSSKDKIQDIDTERGLSPMPLNRRRHSMPASVKIRRPNRCVCIPPGAKFCRPDCDLCPKLGASECLFGKKLPSLSTCDLCDKYGKPGCIFGNDPTGNIEDWTANRNSLPGRFSPSPHSPPPFIKYQNGPHHNIHPEHINNPLPLTPTLESIDFNGASPSQIQKLKNVQRARWHLGIRSQSRPEDIMREIYRTMKMLEMEWKVLDPYHVILRRKYATMDAHIKVSLQLYQVDKRSFLLDFKNLTEEASSMNSSMRLSDEEHSPHYKHYSDSSTDSLGQEFMNGVTITNNTIPPSQAMIFFETCASIIRVLARV